MNITHIRLPIPRHWWEILLLRKPKYDYVSIYESENEAPKVFINGMLQ